MKPGEVHPATHMPVVRYLQVVSDLLDGESRTCKGLDCGPATAYSRLRFSDETVGCVGQIAGDYRQRVAGGGRVLGIGQGLQLGFAQLVGVDVTDKLSPLVVDRRLPGVRLALPQGGLLRGRVTSHCSAVIQHTDSRV